MPTIPSIISGSLPHSSGPYPVGYFTIAHAPFPAQGFVLDSPTIDTRAHANARVYGAHDRGTGGWEEGHVPALGLRRVEYSVWYPCEAPQGWFGRDASPGGVGWLPSPVSDVLEGYTRFMNDSSWLRAAYPFLRGLGGRLRIPVHPGAKPLEKITPPSATASSSPTTSPRTPPLVIFSHGLAGTHLTYSHVCRSLASRGYIVLSISHQDGSGPYASVPGGALWGQGGVVRERQREGALGGDDEGKGVGKIVRDPSGLQPGSKSAETEDVFKLSYLRHNELDWSPDPQPDVMTLRSLQLDIRVHELYATYRSFKTLITSSATSLPAGLRITADSIHHTSAAAVEWLSGVFPPGSVATDEVDLVGHSFGGGTMLWALERGVPEGEEALPVRKAVALDPWVDPLPLPAPVVKTQKDAPAVPLLAINSSRFTLWSTHFTRLKRLVRAANGSLVTLLGAGHETFSDFPLLWAPTGASLALIRGIDDLVYAFLKGELKQCERIRGREVDGGVVRTTTMHKGKETGKERMVGEWGDVVVHELGRD
ncbi:hypothetical protein NliqN6_0059 [Naganishia liquefaciens]|uniref:1-alkyl-2-acetylglycerophosphocholine esterase n=1 Tax=Naganishia liquefaciens TaxID=104408 RepID=A0A8H3TM76_9TREE|nr:hypothetical protein NliqN6_0059 [Naganishia liquefaciens]